MHYKMRFITELFLVVKKIGDQNVQGGGVFNALKYF